MKKLLRTSVTLITTLKERTLRGELLGDHKKDEGDVAAKLGTLGLLKPLDQPQ